MSKMISLSLAALLASSVAASAATLVSQFTFDSDLSDNASGASATGADSIASGLYNFAAGQGLDVTLNAALNSYSLLFRVALDEVSSYRKLLDVSGLTSDNGLYAYNGATAYYSAGGSGGTLAAKTPATIALTFDGTTTNVYVDGASALSFATTGSGYPSVLNEFILVQDDMATGGGEASAGSLDFLEVYSGVMSASDIAAYNGPGSIAPVPLPASGLLLFGAFAGAATLRRNRKRS